MHPMSGGAQIAARRRSVSKCNLLRVALPFTPEHKRVATSRNGQCLHTSTPGSRSVESQGAFAFTSATPAYGT